MSIAYSAGFIRAATIGTVASETKTAEGRPLRPLNGFNPMALPYGDACILGYVYLGEPVPDDSRFARKPGEGEDFVGGEPQATGTGNE
jgi:hypothetical protein